MKSTDINNENFDCEKESMQWPSILQSADSPAMYIAATEQLNIEFTLRVSAGTTQYIIAKNSNLIKALLGVNERFVGRRFFNSRTYSNEFIMDLDDSQLGSLVRIIYNDLNTKVEEWAKENSGKKI